MTEREIRIRGANSEGARKVVLACMSDYERDHLNDGRGEGLRHSVIWTAGSNPIRWKAIVYHTRTAIVGLYQEAANG